MKKIIFIAVALVMALGGLGIGYASWTDQVTINGSLKTGTVCFNASAATSTYVFKDEAPLNNSDDEVYINTTGVPRGTEDFVVASAVTSIAGGDTITITFDNLFPIEEDAGAPLMPYWLLLPLNSTRTQD